jgi:hypothetical protein
MSILPILIFAAGLLAGWQLHRHKQRERDKLMTALETLVEASTKIGTAVASQGPIVDDAVVHILTPGASDVALAAITATLVANTAVIEANNARLSAALNPPPPTP